MKSIITILISAAFLTTESSAQDNASASRSTTTSPNIVVILTDDQGYADISFNTHHPAEVATPHMDALAKEGVFFTNAYTSGHVCLIPSCRFSPPFFRRNIPAPRSENGTSDSMMTFPA